MVIGIDPKWLREIFMKFGQNEISYRRIGDPNSKLIEASSEVFMVPSIYSLHEIIDPVVRRWYILSIAYQCIPEYEGCATLVKSYFLKIVLSWLTEVINKWKYILESDIFKESI